MARARMLAIVLLVGGCGSSHGGGGADLAAGEAADLAGGGGGDDLATTGAPDLSAQSACNNLSLAGAPVVHVGYVQSGAPAFAGGAIADGTYFITSGAFYSGAGGMTGAYGDFQGVYRFAGTTLDLLVSSPKGLASETATIAASGNTLRLTPTCGATGASQELYSVSGSNLSLGMITGSLGADLTLTKQ